MYPCGHPRTPENTQSECCRECRNARSREYQRAVRAGLRPTPVPRVVDPDTFPCGHPRSEGNVGKRGKCLACGRAKTAARRAANPGAQAAAERAQRAARAAYHRRWRAANRERWSAYGRGTQQNIRRLSRNDADTLYWIDLLAGDPCPYCGGASRSVDHIEPRSGGGAHHWTNYAAACHSCNSHKHDAPLLTFLLHHHPEETDAEVHRPV